MPYIGNTGQGATITLGTTGAVGCVRSMQLPEWVVEKIEANCLETVGFGRYTSGDLVDPGDATFETVFDAVVAIPTPGTVETITVTFPIGDSANTTAAVYTGTGFLTTSGAPNLATNELMVLSLVFAFDGDTGPTFTPESA